MHSINGFVNNLKNINPEDLSTVLRDAALGTETKLVILEQLYTMQREAGSVNVSAVELTKLTVEELETGRWIQTDALSGKLTDAHLETIGVGMERRITIVLDGKIHILQPHDKAWVYTMPIEPEEA